MTTDWRAWHRAYDDPGSSLAWRLAEVQRATTAALDQAAPGRVAVLSLCAGEGRDVLGVLEAHPRATDVELMMVDLDEGLLETAGSRAAAIALRGVELVADDAGRTSRYASRAPFGIVLACGIFGNITAEDTRRTIHGLAPLTSVRGSVIWTRHRRQPDRTPAIRQWFDEAGFDEASFVTVRGSLASVGRATLRAAAPAAELPARLFDFVGNGRDALV